MVRRLLLLCCLLLPTCALGWNAGGHRLIAAVAWLELDPGQREKLVALLDKHPDAPRWQRRIVTGDDKGLVLFTEASTWADDIRRDRRFFDEGREPVTITLPGFPEMARRRGWHYLNLPVGAAPPHAHRGGDLDQALRQVAATLADRRESENMRAWALAWLIHLVGDIHQPLHVATRYHPDGGDDAGGNGLPVFDPDNSRRPATNLHAWWDDLPGPPWLRGTRLRIAAEALRRAHPLAAVKPGPADDFDRWRDEGHRLAEDFVYVLPPPPVTISTAYRQQARVVAGERVALAGYRLARLLVKLLVTMPDPEADSRRR